MINRDIRSKYENEEVENLLYGKANVAMIRRIGYENIQREYHSANLSKWENYREERIDGVDGIKDEA